MPEIDFRGRGLILQMPILKIKLVISNNVEKNWGETRFCAWTTCTKQARIIPLVNLSRELQEGDLIWNIRFQDKVLRYTPQSHFLRKS